jgi:uncharacterized protein YccT (UPF0319 family)
MKKPGNWTLNNQSLAIRNLLPTTIAWILVIFLLGLTACQSQPTFQAYPGPAKPAAEGASVFIPKEFNLLNVNGDSYNQPLMGNGTLVRLLPGSHKIVIKYLDFWTINADNVERVESQPMLLSFDAKAGETYRIVSQEFNDVETAKAFVNNPEVDIISDSTKTSVATDIKYHLEDKGLVAAFLDTLSSGDTPAPAPAADEAPRSTGEPALEMLKYWWQKADAQQQEDFMKWVVEK